MLPRQIGCFLAADGPLCGSVRLFLCLGRRDGGPGQNSKRDAGRVGAPGRMGGARSGLWAPRAEQQKKRGPCRCSRQGRRTCAGRAALRGGGAPGRTAKGTRSVAAFQTKRERGRSVRCLGIRRRRQRSRQSEGRSDRWRQRGRRGEGRSDRRRQRSKRGEGRSDRWPQRGRRGTNRHGPNR